MEGHRFVREYANHVLREIGELKSRYGDMDMLVQCEETVNTAVARESRQTISVTEAIRIILNNDEMMRFIRLNEGSVANG